MLASSKVTATSLIAYAEASAAFALRFKEKAFPSFEYKHLVSSFDADWDYYMVMHLSADPIRLAGGLAEKYGLRCFDAIHLS